MADCSVSAFLLLGVSSEMPTPEKPEVLSNLQCGAKLRCSMAPGHPGVEHQAYYGNKLFTWLYPDPADAPSGDLVMSGGS